MKFYIEKLDANNIFEIKNIIYVNLLDFAIINKYFIMKLTLRIFILIRNIIILLKLKKFLILY
jgi:hypothetical protein